MVKSGRVILLVLLICGLWISAAAALSVKAVTGRDQIALGESLQLQIRLDGSADADPDLSPLNKNWEVLRSSQSSQRRIINGTYTSSVVYNLTLMPRTQGSLIIPAICFDQDCSLPLPIEVAPRSSQQSDADAQIQLEASISPQKIVIQGQLLLKVRLSVRAGLPEGQLSDPQPTGVSVQIKKLTDVRKYEQRSNGELYQIFEREYAIFPQESGPLLIPPLQFDGVIAGGRTRLDPYARQGMQVRRTSQPLRVEVVPLPKDLGRRPWIPATDLVLQDDWQQQPPKLVVGEPATRTLRLSAGGVQSAQLPELKPIAPADFKVYPDQPSREDQLTVRGLKGVLEQKTVLIPTRAGRYQLPAFDLEWWDISTGRWQKANLKALTLDVAPAVPVALTTPVVPPVAPVANTSSTGEDASSAASIPIARPLQTAEVTSGFWPWLSLGLALGWLVTLVFLWRALRRRKRTAEQKSQEVSPDEKTARRALLQAAKQHDSQATRQALTCWSRLLYPESGAGAYEQLAKNAGLGLRQQLELLDQSLYGRTGQGWNGSELVVQIDLWRTLQKTEKVAALPDLYP